MPISFHNSRALESIVVALARTPTPTIAATISAIIARVTLFGIPITHPHTCVVDADKTTLKDVPLAA